MFPGLLGMMQCIVRLKFMFLFAMKILMRTRHLWEMRQDIKFRQFVLRFRHQNCTETCLAQHMRHMHKALVRMVLALGKVVGTRSWSELIHLGNRGNRGNSRILHKTPSLWPSSWPAPHWHCTSDLIALGTFVPVKNRQNMWVEWF